MSTLPIPSAGGDFERVPAGTYPAICYRVIDLGRQAGEFQGEKKVQHKVMLSWEIADDEVRMADGRPFTISSRYTWSMHEKAGLRRDLESWRGQAFVDSDFGPGGFDIKKLIGAPCLLTLVDRDKDGKTYTNINAIAKLPRQMATSASPLVNKTAYLWLSKPLFESAVFNELSDNLKQTIMKSPEWADVASIPKAPGENANRPDVFDDDIPF
jgi:hypothetical protein